MKRIHPLLVVAAAVVLIGGAVAWNEGRRGSDAARATTSAAPPPSAEPATSQAPTAPAVEPAPEPVEDPKLAAARALVIDRLKDPDSAQFRNARVMSDGKTVCIEVNAKNGFGGYTGFSQAVVISGSSGAPVAWVDSEKEGIASAACESA